MAKTIRECLRRLLYPVIAVIMVLGLLLAPAAAPPVNAAEVNAEWDRADTPSMDDWKIAPGSDLYLPALGMDGNRIYIIGTMWEDDNGDGFINYTEETARLWKTEDGGATWDDITGNVMKEIRDEVYGSNATILWTDMVAWFNFITADRYDSNFIALSAYLGNITDPVNWTQVVLISDDGGKNFWLLPYPIRDTSAGTNLTDIYNINVGPEIDGVRDIALGGVEDPDRSVVGTLLVPVPTGDEQGRVYRYRTGGLVGGWEDAATGKPGWRNCTAVTWVYFSGMFADDHTIMAVTHNTNATVYGIDANCSPHSRNETYFQTGTWSKSSVNWNEEASRGEAALLSEAPVPWWLIKASSSGITLPLDYDGRNADSRYAWVSLNTAEGGDQHSVNTIYRVVNGNAEPIIQQIPGQPWLAMVFYFGMIDSGKAVAGLLGNGHITDVLTNPVGGLFLGTKCCQGVQVYRNNGITDMDICCQRWKEASKPPTGRGPVAAIIAPPGGTKVYCLSIGLMMGIDADGLSPIMNAHMLDKYDESAFSVSFDDGDTWNQIGLIDTDIDYLSDVAQSPNCNVTYLAAVNLNLTGEHDVAGEGDFVDAGLPLCYECDSVFFKSQNLSKDIIYARGYDNTWFRVWSGELRNDTTLNGADTPQIGIIRLAPEETLNTETVYFVERGSDKVYYDGNKGLGCWEKGTSTVEDISDLAVQDEATIYAVGGNNDDVAVSDDHGFAASWSKTMDSKVDEGHTIAVNGEGNVLVGGADGKVSYSNSDLATFKDGEASFTELKDGLGSGNVHVAFDSYFDDNSVVYAAVGQGTPSNVADNGIYRWVIGTSSSWKNLGECVTPGTSSATPTQAQLDLTANCTRVQVGYYGIVLSSAAGNPETDATTGGVLYATFYDAAGNVTGVARCLNPAEEVACGEQAWDYFIEDTADNHGAFTLEPSSLKLCGCLTPDTNARLWAIDDAHYYNGTVVKEDPRYAATLGRLWTYEDCFAKAAPAIVSPADNAVVDADPCYCWNDAFTLKWERQCDACSYNLQLSRDADFTEVVLNISGKDENTCLENDYEPSSGTNPSYVVGNAALGSGSCGTTFYWRVRSADAETGEVIHSPWSEVRSFTVAAGPGAEVTLTNPSNGAIGVAVTGIPFTWDAVPDATGYEFSMVNADGTDVVPATAVSGITYTYSGTLSDNTSYYWTVKALKAGVVFSQATATFTTASAPVEVPPPTTPAWVWVVIGIGAVLVIVTLVLIFRTRRV